jgi:predicted nucleic acid-binding protein
MHLLDTNVVSELRKVSTGRADPNVAAWVAGVPSGQLFLSVVTLHELEHGVLLAERSDPLRGAILRRWLDGSVARAFDGRILPIDESVARTAAAFHVPDPAPFRDALIGATAQVHGLVMVTRDERDYARFGVLRLLNPWHAAAWTNQTSSMDVSLSPGDPNVLSRPSGAVRDP